MNRKIVIFNHIEHNYTISNPVLLMSNIFKWNINFFKDKNFDVVYFRHLVEDQTIFNCNINYSLNGDQINKVYNDTFVKFIEDVKNNQYNNSILVAYSMLDYKYVFGNEYNKIIKDHGIKRILWRDDLHSFVRINKMLNFNIIDGKYEYKSDLGQYKIDQYEKADLILSPSKLFFKNTDNRYLHKTESFFYCYNENINFWHVNFKKWKNRTDKILLSGSCGKIYPIRYQIKQYITNNINNENIEMIKYMDYLPHPGYKNRSEYANKSGKYYYNKLKQYKGCIFGFGMYPVNFCLAKIVEILFCGCIGFFENSPLLEKKLGLIAFVHYVPILTDNNNNVIFNEKYYLKYLNTTLGKQIAVDGYNYIINNYKTIQRCKQFLKIIKKYEI